MDTAITFTPGQFLACITAICAGISGVAAVVTIFTKIIRKAKAPDEAQDAKINDIDRRVTILEELHAGELSRIEVLEHENHITQRALLAILKHLIDGNDVESMKRSKDELTNYLIDK